MIAQIGVGGDLFGGLFILVVLICPPILFLWLIMGLFLHARRGNGADEADHEEAIDGRTYRSLGEIRERPRSPSRKANGGR